MQSCCKWPRLHGNQSLRLAAGQAHEVRAGEAVEFSGTIGQEDLPIGLNDQSLMAS